MDQSTSFKYRAFLSYSHVDTRVAKRLHRALEGFRVDKDLIGRATPQGALPSTLRPIFRDREDFTAGHTLTEQTLAALDASAALIVLCSPASAKSHYVNEEVRLFRSRHPNRPVVPVIADGTPGDPERECFPPALRFEVSADGTMTDTPATALAADLRESGDGFELAVAKVVARLLDLSTDDVFRRAERARRRSARIRNAVLAIVALLAIAATGSAAYAWQQLRTNEALLNATLARAAQIVSTAVTQAERYNVPRAATLELLTRAEGLFDDMASIGHPTVALRRQKALLLNEFARNYAILGDTAKQSARTEEARGILEALVAEGNADAQTLRVLAIVRNTQGDILQVQGNLAAALAAYQGALDIMTRLAGSATGLLDRDLAVCHNNVGDALLALGRRDEALASFQAAFTISKRLADADPGNAALQRDLSVSYDRVADVTFDTDANAALSLYRESLAIRQRLAGAAPDNTDAQRDVFVSQQLVGSTLGAQGDLVHAQESYQAAFAIIDRLARSDPNNASWQNDLAIANEHLGEVRQAMNLNDEAKSAYAAALAIYTALLGKHADDIAAEVASTEPLMHLGELSGADGRSYYVRALDILKRLDAAGRLAPARKPSIAWIEQRLAALPQPQDTSAPGK